jgi:hypothetical protein
MSSNAIVFNFEFVCIGRTRDEAIALMDDAQLGIMSQIGGAPWVMVDDDITRVHNPALTLCDDQGFVYQGKRSCRFQGPLLDTGTQTYHDGFKPQMQTERQQ